MEIVAENIRATQAIYTAAMLEEIGVFSVADRVVEQFHTGLLPIGPGPAGERLYRYWTGHGARLSEAERRLLYRRALGLSPGADTNATANYEFEGLWLRFVSAVSRYAEQAGADTLDAARTAGRDLAANLSLHGWGGAGYAAGRLTGEVHDATDLLTEPEIGRAYGAQDMWQVVDRVSNLYLGTAPDVRRRRARLDAGQRIFQWLIGSASATEPDIADEALVNAVEHWLAVGGETDRPWRPRDRDIVAEVSRQVGALLARAQATSRLPPRTRARMTRDAIRIATTVVKVRLGPACAGALISQVNFPQFVTGLIDGVFHAIVEASVRQMEAYADLVASVADSVGRFAAESRRRRKRDWLATTMEVLLLGTTRIAVSDGRVKPCLHRGRRPPRRRPR